MFRLTSMYIHCPRYLHCGDSMNDYAVEIVSDMMPILLSLALNIFAPQPIS